MTALIFVYTRTSFKNDGTMPIRRFDPERRLPWTMVSNALDPGTTGYLEPGIYGVVSADNLAVELRPTDGANSADAYDLVILKGKDPWVSVVADAAQLGRVRTLIPPERDADLDQFMIARGGS